MSSALIFVSVTSRSPALAARRRARDTQGAVVGRPCAQIPHCRVADRHRTSVWLWPSVSASPNMMAVRHARDTSARFTAGGARHAPALSAAIQARSHFLHPPPGVRLHNPHPARTRKRREVDFEVRGVQHAPGHFGEGHQLQTLGSSSALPFAIGGRRLPDPPAPVLHLLPARGDEARVSGACVAKDKAGAARNGVTCTSRASPAPSASG